MVAGVEMPVETDRSDRMRGGAALHVQLLGPLTIRRDGVAVTLPASRKVRALLAYLSLADQRGVAQPALRTAVGRAERSARGAPLVPQQGQEHRRRAWPQKDCNVTATPSSSICADCFVDAKEITRATQEGIETILPERLRRLSALFHGEFLDGLEIDRNPGFNGWLTAQRRRFRGCHAPCWSTSPELQADDEVFGYLEKWLDLAPFDQRVHESLLNALARRGRIREGEEHLAATARLFEAEGLDCTPIRDIWRAARATRRRLA